MRVCPGHGGAEMLRAPRGRLALEQGRLHKQHQAQPSAESRAHMLKECACNHGPHTQIHAWCLASAPMQQHKPPPMAKPPTRGGPDPAIPKTPSYVGVISGPRETVSKISFLVSALEELKSMIRRLPVANYPFAWTVSGVMCCSSS